MRLFRRGLRRLSLRVLPLSFLCGSGLPPLLPRLGKLSTKVRLQIGGLWLLLTLTFETVTGLAQGHAPAELLTAYDPATGNLWLLVLLTTAFAPVVVRRKAESSGKKR